MFSFTVEKNLEKARLSKLTTPHGEIQGPFFQFVATRAAIRGAVFPEDLKKMGVQILLSNTYHLHIQPGEDAVAELGGLHGMMEWDGPITTDSGGYQVFSLGRNVSIDEDGVTFQSHTNGAKLRFTPESTIEVERKLGADIIMPLDVCTSFGATHAEVEEAMRKTALWALRCKQAHEGNEKQALYGIMQGGLYIDLREKAAQQMRDLDFFGYSIGGELQEAGKKKLKEVVTQVTDFLPEEKPRYLMGYGTPEDILEAVRAGVDHFDCVLPIRNARHGQIFKTFDVDYIKECLKDPAKPIEPEKLYAKIDVTKSTWRVDKELFAPDHPVITQKYTNAYVHHLMKAESFSGARLAVLQNIWFYAQFMRAIRDVIEGG